MERTTPKTRAEERHERLAAVHARRMAKQQDRLVAARQRLDAVMEAWDRQKDEMVAAGTLQAYCEANGWHLGANVYDAQA